MCAGSVNAGEVVERLAGPPGPLVWGPFALLWSRSWLQDFPESGCGWLSGGSSLQQAEVALSPYALVQYFMDDGL